MNPALQIEDRVFIGIVFRAKPKKCGDQRCLAGHCAARDYDRSPLPSDHACMHEDSSAGQDPDAEAHVRVEGVQDWFEFSVTCQPPSTAVDNVQQAIVSA